MRGAAPPGELQVERALDQGQMGGGVGEVALQRAAQRIDRRGQEADVVGASEQALEQQPGVLGLADRELGIDQPEAAEQAGAGIGDEPASVA